MLYKAHVFLVNRKCQISMIDRKPDSAPLGIPYYFCNLSMLQSLLKICLGQRFFGKKNAKNVMKNPILKPPAFTLIMLLSIQPVKIPEKITVFLIILVESSIFSVGLAKTTKNGVLIQ